MRQQTNIKEGAAINPRWERNERDIKALERAIERSKAEIESLEKDEELSEKVKEAKILDLRDLTEDLMNEIRNLKKSFTEIVEEARNDLMELYYDEEDKRDWAVAWSGGKDSTVVMGLVVSMLEKIPEDRRKRKIHAVMSDTKMENPNLEGHMHEQVERLNEYAERNGLPISAKIVSRDLEQSYFYLVLGKGYFLPQNNGTGRWCTARLKIHPQNEELKRINPSFILMGTRLSESMKRKQSIKKWRKDSSLNAKIGEHVNLKESNTFMPIVDFTIDDVWEYLQKEGTSWSSTHGVRTLYRDATGECGFTSPKRTEMKATVLESCGARFGCWTCPVILKDKSTEEMAKRGNDWMKPLSEWRFLQLKVMGDYKPDRPEGQRRKQRSKVLRTWEEVGREVKLITKSGHKMDGKRMLDRKTGEPRDDHGTVTVEARKYLFDKLLETQEEVNKLRIQSGLEPLELIGKEEQRMIKERWEEDAKERPWLLTNVNKIPFCKFEEWIREGERRTELINAGEL